MANRTGETSLCEKCKCWYAPWEGSRLLDKIAYRGHPSFCRDCYSSIYNFGIQKSSSWRGKGSFGSKPGEAVGENFMEDIIGKIEDGETETDGVAS